MTKMALLAAAAVLASTGSAAAATAVQPADAPAGATTQLDGSIRLPEETIDQLRARAERGDRGAQLDLGGRLLDSGSEADAAEARRWFQRAAEAGNVEAKNAYASMLIAGAGGPADAALGRRLMEEAAREGSVGANLTLADRYLHGDDGYPSDARRAFQHTAAAAAAERASGRGSFAQWSLAMMHLRGTGTRRNSEEAYRILVATSEAGGVRAMISRAVMLATGDGVAKDAPAARHWYQRAAESGERGFEHALRSLGAMLALGEGGAVDLPRGLAYLRIAQAANDELAGRVLAEIADRVTPEIDAEARRIAEEWMQRHLPRE